LTRTFITLCGAVECSKHGMISAQRVGSGANSVPNRISATVTSLTQGRSRGWALTKSTTVDGDLG
jgi:hypothetical protein